MAVADKDGFNWGYDPYHYTVPEGSDVHEPRRRHPHRRVPREWSRRCMLPGCAW